PGCGPASIWTPVLCALSGAPPSRGRLTHALLANALTSSRQPLSGFDAPPPAASRRRWLRPRCRTSACPCRTPCGSGRTRGSGHVVDPAVAGDVALDAAACGCLGLSHGPTLGAELPSRPRGTLPDAAAFGFGRRLLLHVAGGVAHECPGIALAHHPRVDILALDEAHGQRATVLVSAAGQAS